MSDYQSVWDSLWKFGCWLLQHRPRPCRGFQKRSVSWALVIGAVSDRQLSLSLSADICCILIEIGLGCWRVSHLARCSNRLCKVGCNVLGGSATWAGVSIAFVLMVAIYALGGISGANFNPAVSVQLGLKRTPSLPGFFHTWFHGAEDFGNLQGHGRTRSGLEDRGPLCRSSVCRGHCRRHLLHAAAS